jgi:hypothetical protein
VAADSHLDERQVARHGGYVAQILDFQHVHQLVEIRHHPVCVHLIAVQHDRHARDPGQFGAADGQRLDIERAPPEQRRHAIQHAGFVFDEGDECVKHTETP